MARVTIGDVAEQAGVSIATVSRVVNGRYGVAAETQGKVQAVIANLGYESSLVARSLRNRRTNVIGIIVPDLEPFSTELLKGVGEAIRNTGRELVVYSGGGLVGDHAGWERRYVSRLNGTLTEGTILVTPTVVDVASTAPVVAVDPHTGPSSFPTVYSQNREGATTATEYLIGLGHQRIGYLGGRPDLESSRLREQGYRDALAAAGIPFDRTLVRVGGYSLDGTELPAHELLEMADRPTAIFAANDISAIQTMRVAAQLEIAIPGDLSVIGFDNIPESAQTNPPLTTIDQSIQAMGYEAVRLLLELIEDPDRSGPIHITLPTTLVIRQSCRPLVT
jgi:LacI family transcriptional regulator